MPELTVNNKHDMCNHAPTPAGHKNFGAGYF